MNRRIFVSVTREHNLSPNCRTVRQALLKRLVDAGFEPQEFLASGIPESYVWSFDNVDKVVRQCVGALIVGFTRWEFGNTRFVNEYNHYEAAVAITHGLPVLLLAEKGTEKRGVMQTGGGKPITFMPDEVTPEWLEGEEFTRRWDAWRREITERRDVFLGYCSSSAGIAAQIQLRLERHGATVLNWAMDFRAGGTILGELEDARSRCTCGIFLFTEDDPLEGRAGVAAPRDNVLFEAGYFMSTKGPGRCLIVRGAEAKMPADVGGAIYLTLGRDANVNTIESGLTSFLDRSL